MTAPKNKQIPLSYQLSYDEINEAFMLLLKKRSDRHRNLMGAILFLIAVVMVICYALFPAHLEYSALALCSVFAMFAILWYPSAKAKKQAKKLSRLHGTYEVTFDRDGFLQPKGQPKIALNGDKDAKAFETETLFVIRPDRFNTFILPKRVLPKEDQDTIRQTLAFHLKNFSTGSSRRQA